MNNRTETTGIWIAAAIVLVLLVIGVSLWYSSAATPVPQEQSTTSNMSTDTPDITPSSTGTDVKG